MRMFLKGLYDIWMKFAGILGRVQTAIILFLIYFLGVGFTAVISFIFMKDFLGKSLQPKRPTFWCPREAPKANMKNSKRQF